MCKDKIIVRVTYLSVWCHVGDLGFSKEHSFEFKGVLVRKKSKKVWQAGSLCLFRSAWKVRNVIAFKDEVCPWKNSKLLLCFIFGRRLHLSILDGPLTLVEFIDWVRWKWVKPLA